MRAGKNPQARADLLTAFLNERRKQLGGEVWPGIQFGPNCTSLIDSILQLRWKPQENRLGEDPRETFVKKNDHGFDSLSYGLCAVPPPGILAPKLPETPPYVNLPASVARQIPQTGKEWVEV
jgi:hypothetical protein